MKKLKDIFRITGIGILGLETSENSPIYLHILLCEGEINGKDFYKSLFSIMVFKDWIGVNIFFREFKIWEKRENQTIN